MNRRDGFIKFTDSIAVNEIIEDGFDIQYHEEQFNCEMEISVPYVEVVATFTVTWDDPDINVDDMWFDICGEFSRPQQIDCGEVVI